VDTFCPCHNPAASYDSASQSDSLSRSAERRLSRQSLGEGGYL
jgi:hypothetical protein